MCVCDVNCSENDKDQDMGDRAINDKAVSPSSHSAEEQNLSKLSRFTDYNGAVGYSGLRE